MRMPGFITEAKAKTSNYYGAGYMSVNPSDRNVLVPQADTPEQCLSNCLSHAWDNLPWYIKIPCSGTCVGCITGNLIGCAVCVNCLGGYATHCAISCGLQGT